MPSVLRTVIYQVIAFGVLLIAVLVGYFYFMMRPIRCTPICVGANLAGRDLRGLDLQSVSFVEANLTGVNLRGANLREADFSGAQLVGANLRNTDLTDAQMIGADMTRANLNESLLKGADLSGAILSEADLTGLDLTETVVNGASFSKAKLTGVQLQNANLTGIDFSSSNLSGADFTNANLSGSRLSQADVSGAQLINSLLVGGWLNQTNLTGADLSGANLVGSQIIGGRLTSANLTNSNLQGAITVGANFDGANLRGANLQQMRVSPTQLSQQTFLLDPLLATLNELQRNALLINVNVSGVQYDEQTQWANNLTPFGVISSTEPLTATLSPIQPTTALTNGTLLSATTTANLRLLNPITDEETISATVSIRANEAVSSSESVTASALLPSSISSSPFDRPVAKQVKFNIFINSLDNINELSGTFDADFYVELSWQDEPLAANPLALQTAGQNADAKVLDPKIEVVNAKEMVTRQRFYALSTDPGSNIRLRTWLRGRLTAPFDLRDFPFDRQHLAIKIESTQLDSEHLLFNFAGLQRPAAASEEAIKATIPKGRYVALGAVASDWGIESVDAVQQVRVLGYDNSSWSQARIELTLRRVTAPAIRRLVFGMGFLLFLAWGVFWIDSRELHLRLWMVFVLFIVLNLFNIILWQKLPNLPYLTFLDRCLFSAYSMIVLIALFSLVSYWLMQRGWYRVGRWLNRGLAIGYPIVLAMMTVGLLGTLGN